MLFTLPIAIAGYAVIANIHAAMVKYGMTFLMATGMYASVPCILVWNSNNSAGSYKRATTSAVQLAIANCGGFVASMSLIFCETTEADILQHSTTPAKTNRSTIEGIPLCSDFLYLHGLCE